MNTDTITIRRRAKFQPASRPLAPETFETAYLAAVSMLGTDTAKYEVSVGGVYHRFWDAEVKAIQKQIERMQIDRAKAKVRAMGLGR